MGNFKDNCSNKKLQFGYFQFALKIRKCQSGISRHAEQAKGQYKIIDPGETSP